MRPLWTWQRLQPPQLIALSFALLIAVGTGLLALPAAHVPGGRLGLVQALFMATSAVCVTGLAVVDVSTELSAFGQVVLIALVQLGGLGVLTFGTLALLLLRRVQHARGLGVGDRLRLAGQLNSPSPWDIARLLRALLMFTVISETVGTVLLALRFVPELGWERGIAAAAFHAVSAFNNAGFSTFASGLVPYATDPLVSTVVPALFILGGIGFLVQLNVLLHLRSPRRVRLSTHTKVALTMTGALLLLGSAGYLLAEWNNPATLGALPEEARPLAAFFASATARTAGFNTVDYAGLLPVSLGFTMVLMLIGANSGSTGGGLKTGTVFVMLAGLWGLLRGKRDVVVFHRRIPELTVLRAFAVALLSGLILGAGMLALLLLQPPEALPVGPLLFEAVSAFATVGLSQGVTAALGEGQQLVLVALMFLGRVGPLTFALAVTRRDVSRLRAPQDAAMPIG